MTDTSQKLPVTSSFAPIVMTGMGSSAIGDQLGDAISQLISWVIAVHCNCVPPDKVISSVHTICVVLIVSLAYTVHYLILKHKES